MEEHAGVAGTMIARCFGGLVAQAIGAAAELGVADSLKDGAREVEDLAQELGADAPALYRLLRCLASHQIFEQVGPRRFTLNAAAEVLRSDVPGSLRATAIMCNRPWLTRSYEQMGHSVRTGQQSFEHVFGKNMWDYFAETPADAQNFNVSMTGFAANVHAAAAEAHDFSGIQRLVDVGGGHGHLLSRVLRSYPAIHGVLLEQPAVIESARAEWEGKDLAARLTLVAGDFFVSVPEGADAYMMSYILHNWDDERAALILKNCRRAMTPNGQLIVIDPVIKPGNQPDFGKTLDLAMLTVLGGRERTEEEFAALFSSAGFALERVVATRSPSSIILGTPV